MLLFRVLENRSFHSMLLHYLNEVLQNHNQILRAQALLATKTNKNYLKEIGLSDETLEQTEPNDLIVVAEVEDEADETLMDALIERAEQQTNQQVNIKNSERKVPETLNQQNYLSQKETKSPFFLRDFSEKRKMGVLHSVFCSSFNVAFDDELLNFSTTGMPLAPHGCVLNSEKIQKIVEHGQMNDLVKWENGKFTFYTRGEIIPLDLSDLEASDLTIPRLRVTTEQIKDTATYQVLEQLSFEEHIGLELSGGVLESTKTLENISNEKAPAIEQAVQILIGRGSGLTPSGDDILLGYLMIRQAIQPEDKTLNLLKKGLKHVNTTAISMAYYEGLLSRYVSSLFLGLIHSMESKSKATTKQLIQLITRYGHTSGYDTLFGFYLGLTSLDNEA